MFGAEQKDARSSRGRCFKGAALVVALVVSAYAMIQIAASSAGAWLAWFSLVPVFVAIRGCRPSGAMLAGAFWGLCLYGFSAWGSGLAVTRWPVALTLLVVVPAVYGYLGARLTRWVGFSPFALGVGWMGVEFALERCGLGGGLIAGEAEAGGGILAWIGDALGYVVVAFVIALASASLVSVFGSARLPMLAGPCLGEPADAGRYCLSNQTFAPFRRALLRVLRPRAPPAIPIAS